MKIISFFILLYSLLQICQCKEQKDRSRDNKDDGKKKEREREEEREREKKGNERDDEKVNAPELSATKFAANEAVKQVGRIKNNNSNNSNNNNDNYDERNGIKSKDTQLVGTVAKLFAASFSVKLAAKVITGGGGDDMKDRKGPPCDDNENNNDINSIHVGIIPPSAFNPSYPFHYYTAAPVPFTTPTKPPQPVVIETAPVVVPTIGTPPTQQEVVGSNTGTPTIIKSDNPSRFTDFYFTSYPSNIPSTYPSLLPSSQPSSTPTIDWSTSDNPSSIPSTNPSSTPSESPTEFPTPRPSLRPTRNPTSNPTTLAPTNKPSNHPTKRPTSNPTRNPTRTPTAMPTYERDEDTYWTYRKNSKYGPNYWKNVKTSSDGGGGDPIFEYFMDGKSDNQCDSNGQSPVILQETHGLICSDDHQQITQRGDHDFDEIQFDVLPHVLRARFKEDDESDSSNRAPRTDFSDLSPFIPAVFMDLKIPSEHYMMNDLGVLEYFPGEIQIAHHFKEENKIVMIGFFVDYRKNMHNYQLEDFILKWEDIHDSRNHMCEFGTTSNYIPKYKPRSRRQMEWIWGDEDGVPGTADWDLYKLLPTVYYYGYDGSFTAPPCQEGVVWRFLDLPLHISIKQYNRLRRVLVSGDQKDNQCRWSSKAYEWTVNRPLQWNKNEIFRCTGFAWSPKYPEEWCGKWPETYHGSFWLNDVC